MSHELNHSFERESGELVGDISSQLSAVGAFKDQEKRLQMLHGQVGRGRIRVGALSERLDSVNRRLSLWEHADKAWQERTRKRLKVVWIVTSILVLLVMLLFLACTIRTGKDRRLGGESRRSCERELELPKEHYHGNW